jgi:hypothetical protein
MKIDSVGRIFFPSLPNGTVSTDNNTGQLTTASDKNLKIDAGFIENAIDKVLRLKPRYFYWKDDNIYRRKNLGFYAQEVNDKEHCIRTGLAIAKAESSWKDYHTPFGLQSKDK